MPLDQAKGSTMVMFFFRVGGRCDPFLLSALFYLGAKGMCKTMFLHFVPVDGVEYFPQNCWREKYVFMFLCWENRQNLHVFNLWPVIYHTKKNSCANPTPEMLSVEIYTSQHDYPKSTHFYFVAINISQQKTVPV
jgi:hypothetical protein